MDYEFLISNFPFLLMIMSLYLFLELVKLNRILKMWEIDHLMIIPALVFILCLWVGIFEPSLDFARYILRLAIATSLGISIHVVHSYNKAIRTKGDS